MLCEEKPKLCILLSLFVAACAKSPSGAPWTTFTGKSSVYTRSVDPAATSGFNAISVPKAAIGKKIDPVKNAFGLENSIYKRGIFGPFGAFGAPFPLMNPAPFAAPYGYPDFGPYGPQFPYAKSGTSRRKRSLDDEEKVPNLGPFPPLYPGLSTITEEPEEPNKKSALEYLQSPFGPLDPFEPITDEPVTSTIVPPSYWLPSAIVPGPTEYTDKVSNFLGKLFDNLKLNATKLPGDAEGGKFEFARALDPKLTKKMARSADDFSKIASAKDAIVDSILSELSSLKGDMITTLDDFASYQKTAPEAKKSSKFSGFGPWAKPMIDPFLPFKQRMLLIGQVFDMLTGLQRNITTFIQDSSFNATLADAIKSKLATLDPNFYASSSPKIPAPSNPTSFWVAYPQNSGADVKRQVEDYPWQFSGNKYQNPREINMQVHQGYQSMPPGTVESIQVGGGSNLGRQGGGMKLSGFEDYENMEDFGNRRRNHH